MNQLHPVTFPLLPIVQTPEGPACACARGIDCARIGKHPAVEWRDVTADSPSPGRLKGGGVGLRTGVAPRGSNLIVVDVDSKEAAAEIERRGGFPETRTVITGRPGLQYYFQPEEDFPIHNSVGANGGLFPGIDIRGEGGFVVMPGSPHRSGRAYRTLNPDTEIARMPTWLVDWLRERPARAPVGTYDGDVEGDALARRREIYADYLQTTEPCVSGQGGDQRLFEVVQYGAWDLALPTDDVLELIEEHFDERCDPPWGLELEERVLHKAHFAKTQSTRPRNPPISEEEQDAWEDLVQAPKTDLDLADLADLATPDAEEPEKKSDGPFKIQWGGWADVPLPPEYLVDSLLIENKVSMIYADPGSIKTWVAISIALAVASGEPWLERRAVKPGPVLYIDFEDGVGEFHRRVHFLDGGDVGRLGFAYSPGRLSDTTFWRSLAEVVKENDIRLVIIDTLASGNPGVDENSREAGDPLLYAGKVTEALPGVSFLFLHHANKSGGLRGTGAFIANVDTLFHLQKEQTAEDGVEMARLTCVKSGQKKVLPNLLKLSDAGGLELIIERKEPEVDLMRDADEEQDRRTFAELRAEILLLLETHGPVGAVEFLCETARCRKSRANAVLQDLAGSGRAVRLPEGWAADSDDLRKLRVRKTAKAYPDSGKQRIAALACVSGAQFDHLVALGHLVRMSADDTGYVWIDNPAVVRES